MQKDIAKILGISQQYYSEYESGKRTIPVPYLIELSKHYNVSVDYLLGLSDTKKKTNQLKQKLGLFFA